MEEKTSIQLAEEIASNVLKATAATTARDLEIQALQLNYKHMFDQNTVEHTSINESLVLVTEKLDKLIEKMDTRYASKWTEKAWIWLFTCSGVVVVWLLIRWLLLLDIK